MTHDGNPSPGATGTLGEGRGGDVGTREDIPPRAITGRDAGRGRRVFAAVAGPEIIRGEVSEHKKKKKGHLVQSKCGNPGKVRVFEKLFCSRFETKK